MKIYIAIFVVGTALGALAGLKIGNDRLVNYKANQTEKVVTVIDKQTEVIEKVVEKEVEKVVYRDKYIDRVRTVIQTVSEPLRSCPVTPDAVRLWNNVAECALRPSETTCNADAALSGTGTPTR